MKRCPKCRLLYSDANLRFCRYDGAPLVNDAPVDEATTRLFSTGKLNDRLASLQERRRGKVAARNNS